MGCRAPQSPAPFHPLTAPACIPQGSSQNLENRPQTCTPNSPASRARADEQRSNSRRSSRELGAQGPPLASAMAEALIGGCGNCPLSLQPALMRWTEAQPALPPPGSPCLPAPASQAPRLKPHVSQAGRRGRASGIPSPRIPDLISPQSPGPPFTASVSPPGPRPPVLLTRSYQTAPQILGWVLPSPGPHSSITFQNSLCSQGPLTCTQLAPQQSSHPKSLANGLTQVHPRLLTTLGLFLVVPGPPSHRAFKAPNLMFPSASPHVTHPIFVQVPWRNVAGFPKINTWSRPVPTGNLFPLSDLPASGFTGNGLPPGWPLEE